MSADTGLLVKATTLAANPYPNKINHLGEPSI